MSDELLIETTTSFIEVETVQYKIVSAFCSVTNMSDICIAKANGSTAKTPQSTALEDRPEYLTFIRVSCTIDGSSIDKRINFHPFQSRFCLKLLQSSYDKRSKVFTAIDTPVSRIKIVRKSTASGANLGTTFSTVSTTTTPPQSTTTSTTTTPSMDKLLGLYTGGSGDVISYYGDLTFLDVQGSFFDMFGDDSTLLSYLAVKK